MSETDAWDRPGTADCCFEHAGVTKVVMEATGQDWFPIWQTLEDRQSMELLMVNARHVRMLPGRKTDAGDAAWLAELLEHDLLQGSFVPPRQVRELRDLTRYRKRVIQDHTSEAPRLEKVLEDAAPSSTSSLRTCWACPAEP